MDTSKKLYRSRQDRFLAGVAGGMAEHFGIDSSLMRVIFILVILVTGGMGIIAYIVMALAIPQE